MRSDSYSPAMGPRPAGGTESPRSRGLGVGSTGCRSARPGAQTSAGSLAFALSRQRKCCFTTVFRHSLVYSEAKATDFYTFIAITDLLIIMELIKDVALALTTGAMALTGAASSKFALLSFS